MPPLTIDSLGPEISTRYAQDQQRLDQSLIKDARTIVPQTGIDSTTPFYPSEVDALFSTDQKGLAWGVTTEPPHYADQARRVFTSQIVPSLGSEERRAQQIKRIQSLPQTQTMHYEQNWEREQARNARQVEAEKLEAMYTVLGNLEKDYADINAFRAQYHKG